MIKWLQKQIESRKLTELPAELSEFSQEEMNADLLKDKARYEKNLFIFHFALYNNIFYL